MRNIKNVIINVYGNNFFVVIGITREKVNIFFNYYFIYFKCDYVYCLFRIVGVYKNGFVCFGNIGRFDFLR